MQERPNNPTRRSLGVGGEGKYQGNLIVFVTSFLSPLSLALRSSLPRLL